TRKGKSFDSRYGLLYKVDRGERCGDNHRQSGEKVRVGQHSVPLRPSGRNSLGQRLMDSWREQIGAWSKESRPAWLNLDLLEERREHAAIRKAKAKLKRTKDYNARVRGVTFIPEDFVYRSNDASHAVEGRSLAQSEKDLMRSQKHLETERTS
nr:reverse transcriptase domain-containing protein [Tanacetum cinerariifolium]